MSSKRPRHPVSRRGFTLIELMIAGLIAALVLGGISVSIGQLGRAKHTSKERLLAHLRADAALNNIRRDVISVIRTDDLYFTRLVLYDDVLATPVGDLDRDEIVVFNTRLRPVRDIDNFNGEGIEYETHYRIADDDQGPVLWLRRDTFPDEYPLAGGMAQPAVDGIVGLAIEVYDGDSWYSEWDSDEQGLPLAVQIWVTSSGHKDGEDVYDATLVDMRTVVPIDRVLQPRDIFETIEMELREQEAEEAAEGAGLGGADGADGPPDPADLDIPGIDGGGGGGAGGAGRPGRDGGGFNGGGGGDGGGGSRPPAGGGGRDGGGGSRGGGGVGGGPGDPTGGSGGGRGGPN